MLSKTNINNLQGDKGFSCMSRKNTTDIYENTLHCIEMLSNSFRSSRSLGSQ